MMPQLVAALVECPDGESVGVDEFCHGGDVAEMTHRFVAELERDGRCRQVPVLEPATAEAVDALLHANHTNVGHGGKLESGDFPCDGVHGDEGTLLSAHKEKRLIALALRKVHDDSVLVDDIINGVLKDTEFAVHTGKQNVTVERNKHLREGFRYNRYKCYYTLNRTLYRGRITNSSILAWRTASFGHLHESVAHLSLPDDVSALRIQCVENTIQIKYIDTRILAERNYIVHRVFSSNFLVIVLGIVQVKIRSLFNLICCLIVKFSNVARKERLCWGNRE